MTESKPKNSQLIQQLCKHIANLEETNTRLNEELIKADNEKELLCAAFGVASWQEIIDGLQNKEPFKGKGEIGFGDTLSSVTGKATIEDVSFREHRTPLRKKDNNESACESPIESESRIINKEIRGDTDRSEEGDPWCKKVNEKSENCKMFNYSLDDIAGHSISKENLILKSWEEENMLLSVENTKLRQRVAKLEAFVVSRENY